MATIDRIVLAAIALCSVAFVAVLFRRGTRGQRLFTASVVGFNGIALSAMMLGHTVDIAGRLYIGTSYEGAPMTYDFRRYSLFLLAAVLVACGIALLRAAWGIASGTGDARRNALRAAAVTLAVVVPLLPLQLFFALIHTVLASISVAVVALHRS